MTWTVEIEATYDAGERHRLADVMGLLATQDGVVATLQDLTVSIRYEYGGRSKHGAVGAAVNTLHEVFDPVADDEYYHAWPATLTVKA